MRCNYQTANFNSVYGLDTWRDNCNDEMGDVGIVTHCRHVNNNKNHRMQAVENVCDDFFVCANRFFGYVK